MNDITVLTVFCVDSNGSFEKATCPFCSREIVAYYDPKRPMAPETPCRHYVTVDAASGKMTFTAYGKIEGPADVYDTLSYVDVGEKVAGQPTWAAQVETLFAGQYGDLYEVHTDGQFYWLKVA